MKALDLKEGQSLVDRIAAVQMRGKLELLSHQFGELVLAPPGFDASTTSATKVLLSKRAAEAALRADARPGVRGLADQLQEGLREHEGDSEGEADGSAVRHGG